MVRVWPGHLRSTRWLVEPILGSHVALAVVNKQRRSRWFWRLLDSSHASFFHEIKNTYQTYLIILSFCPEVWFSLDCTMNFLWLLNYMVLTSHHLSACPVKSPTFLCTYGRKSSMKAWNWRKTDGKKQRMEDCYCTKKIQIVLSLWRYSRKNYLWEFWKRCFWHNFVKNSHLC